MLAGPGDEMSAGTAGRGQFRTSHPDREQVIELLKEAFVRGGWVVCIDTFGMVGIGPAWYIGVAARVAALPRRHAGPPWLAVGLAQMSE